MDRSGAERSVPAGATVANSAMQVAAWRQLWRLLLQPMGGEPLPDEAASNQEADSRAAPSAVSGSRRRTAPAPTGAG